MHERTDFSKTTRFLYCSPERSLEIASSLFCSKICENGRDNTSVQSRTRSYRFSSRRETARSLERSQRIPYFTKSEKTDVIFLSGDSSSCCSFLTFVNLRCFFFLSFFRRDNKKVAAMVISIVQLQSSIKKTLIIRLHYPTC